MASIDNSESKFENTTRIHQLSLPTAHTDVSDDECICKRVGHAIKLQGHREWNDGMRPNIEQSETPAVPESKPKVDNVVLGNS